MTIEEIAEKYKSEEVQIAYKYYLEGDEVYMLFLQRYLNNELTEKDSLNIIELCDFSLLGEKGNYSLKDEQGANLNGIEEEKFGTIKEVIERLEIYIHDLFFRS